MLKEAILRYKWYVLGSLLMIIGVVASSLLQPHYLKDVLSAVIQNNQDKIYDVGRLLLIIALVGLVSGTLNTVLSAKIAQGV